MTPTEPASNIPALSSFMDGLMNPEGSTDAPITPDTPAPPDVVPDTPAPTLDTPGPEIKTEPTAKSDKKGAAALLDEPEPEKPADDPKDKAPDGSDEKATYKWGELRAEAKRAGDLEKKVQSLEVALAEARKLPAADPLNAKIAEMQKAIEEREAKIASYDVQESKAFKETITIPQTAARTRCEALAKASEIPFSRIKDAIFMPEHDKFLAALDEIVDGLSPAKQFSIIQEATTVRQLEIQAQDIIANAKPANEEAKALQQAEAAKAALERKATQMRGIEEFGKRMAGTFKLLAFEGGPEADKITAEIMAEAQAVPLDEIPEEDRIAAVIALPALARAKDALKAQSKLIDSLRRQLSGGANAAPKASDGSAHTETELTPDALNDGRGSPGSALVDLMFKGVPGR